MRARVPTPRESRPSRIEEAKHIPRPYKLRRYYTPKEVSNHNISGDVWVSPVEQYHELMCLGYSSWGLGFRLKHAVPSMDDFGNTATPGTFGHGGHFLVNTAWGDPGKDLAVCILSNGLTAPRTGTRAVNALSQAIHDAVDASN